MPDPTEPTRIVVFHPDDLNTADVKAACALYGSAAQPSPHCPRGTLFIFDPKAIAMPTRIIKGNT